MNRASVVAVVTEASVVIAAVAAVAGVLGHVTWSLVLLVHHTRQIHLCVSCSLCRVVECCSSTNLGQSK